MPKLTYWVAMPKDDSPVYAVRARTRREVQNRLTDSGYDPKEYKAPKKVAVEYDNAFHLLEQCLGGESHGWWEWKD